MKKNNTLWDPYFHLKHPIFYELDCQSLSWTSFSDWPDLSWYNFYYQHKIANIHGAKSVNFVNANGILEMPQYELMIYHQNSVQTRAENWHDFFNALMWSHWPLLKKKMNFEQARAITKRAENGELYRTQKENVLTLFDENGVIITCSDENLFYLLRAHEFKKLFYFSREEMRKKMHFYFIGHSIYEKMLFSYLNITASALLLLVPENFNDISSEAQMAYLDVLLSEKIDELNHPGDLQPLPVFGIPDWDSNNNQEKFYDNACLFRAARKNKMAKIFFG